jgi:two-component system, response regulator
MRPRQIMVVEDSDEDFYTVQDAARRAGILHPIVRARSGAECLHLLRASQGSRDALTLLVLLDLNTPGDDGRDVLRMVRSDEALSALPVVVLSASANTRDLQFCYANGANAYHVKPVDHALHLKVLQDIFAYWLGSVVLPA